MSITIININTYLKISTNIYLYYPLEVTGIR